MSRARETTIDAGLLAVARGDAPADLLLADARIVDVFNRRVERGAVAIRGSRIASVGPTVAADRVERLEGAWIAPGLIDAHMHLESTMMLPAEFARIAVPRGTTAVVLDPHEIANVAGVEGIRFLMDRALGLPIHALFAVSSCVPASPLETAGASLDADDLAPLFDDDRVVGLAEMMNFPGVIAGDPDVLAKVELGLRCGIVDGHCPGLGGHGLQAYVASGISSDHECTTAAEALDRVRLGMRVYAREGSAARNLEAILPAITAGNAHRFCFCTDDRHPADLIEEGHVDHVVRRAVALGLDVATALAIATLHPAEHYRRFDLGAVAPGRSADLIVFDDPDDLRPRQVYFQGRLVAESGRLLDEVAGGPTGADDAVRNTVHLPPSLDERMLKVSAGRDGATIRVIGMEPHQLLTSELHRHPAVADGHWVADPDRDLLKLAVIERHRGTGNIGLGFVHGFGLSRGAIASTVGHDAHNLAVVGASDDDMILAARALAESGGGQCAVLDGRVEALLPLPIAGLLSAEPAERIVEQQRRLLAAARGLGCPLDDPFMPLSFLSLTVIPSLKLSDQGLVDVDRFEIVPLEVSG